MMTTHTAALQHHGSLFQRWLGRLTWPVADAADKMPGAAAEAAAVRALADRYRESDRGFASDLYAAADRHEAEAAARR
jgi:hypothetical protein